MTSTQTQLTAGPSTGLILRSLLRADFTVFLKNRRSLILSILLPYLILVSTGSKKGTAHLGGSLFIIGLAITYGIDSTSIMGYSLAVARDREKGVFQRLRVTPASTWAIMASRLSLQILANLISNGIEVTRENYLDCAYIGLPMPEWTAELESELPYFLQLETG